MRQVILILFLLSSMVSATIAEASNLCYEDSVSQMADHHSDEESHPQDHCHHVCGQCHFAALIPNAPLIKTNIIFHVLIFSPSSDRPRTFISSLYRPPIC